MTYRVNGTDLTHNGKILQLHGTNWGGMEYAQVIDGLYAGKSMSELIARVKAMRFNHLRIPFSPLTLKNVDVPLGLTGADWNPKNAHLLGKKSLEVMDLFIEELDRQGMRYYLDHHYLEAGHPGNIPPKWYTDKYSHEDWIRDNRFVADRYKGSPGFVGIDSRNEPNIKECTWGTGDRKTDWKLANEELFQSLNEVNKNIILIIETLGDTCDYMLSKPPAIPDDRWAIGKHVYFDSVWGPYNPIFKDPKAKEKLPPYWGKMFMDVAQKKLVIVGEWGGHYVDADKTAQDSYADESLKRKILNTSYWTLGPNSGDTGGIFLDAGFDKTNEGKLKMLDRLWTDKATYTTQKQTDPGVTPVKFKTGDIVELISGSPAFTVEVIDGDKVNVIYYSVILDKIERATLPAVALRISAKATKMNSESMLLRASNAANEERFKREKANEGAALMMSLAPRREPVLQVHKETNKKTDKETKNDDGKV